MHCYSTSHPAVGSLPEYFTELPTVTSWAGTYRMGQRHTFNGSQGTKCWQKEKRLQEEFGETAQSNQTAFYDSRDCLPSTFTRTLREPRTLFPQPTLSPRHFLCLHCASSRPTRDSLPLPCPSEPPVPDSLTEQPQWLPGVLR